MANDQYIVIPKQFVNRRQFQKIGVNMFHAVQTLDNRWVVSANTLIEFADFFAEFNINTSNVQIITLQLSDFPNQPNLK